MDKFTNGQIVVFTGVSEKLKYGDIGKVINYCGLLNYKVEINGSKYIVSHGFLSDYNTYSLLLMKDLQDKVESLEKRIQQLENKEKEDKVFTTNIYNTVSDTHGREEIVSELYDSILKKIKDKPTLSNNELRKKIIKEAKQFVEEHEPYTFKTIIKETGELEYKKVKQVEYKVDVNNKIVTCERFYQGSTHTNKAVAKCLDTDVFNVHIGKAIALGRLKGLDVSKFEEAIQPNEKVEGMIVKSEKNYPDALCGAIYIGELFKLVNTNEYKEGNECHVDSAIGKYSSIYDDSNAKY